MQGIVYAVYKVLQSLAISRFRCKTFQIDTSWCTNRTVSRHVPPRLHAPWRHQAVYVTRISFRLIIDLNFKERFRLYLR